MPAALPSNVPLNSGSVPAWAAVATTALNNVLSANWDMGQRTKQVTITAAQFSLADFSPALFAVIGNYLNEYRAAGWTVTLAGSVTGESGRATSLVYEFARF
jgi:hypothetical protein